MPPTAPRLRPIPSRPSQVRHALHALHLARLIATGPEWEGAGPAGRSETIRRRLLWAIARERRRAHAAHWSYSRARHRALIAAMAEEKRLAGLI